MMAAGVSTNQKQAGLELNPNDNIFKVPFP